ncbi:MAG: response regulator transcription factor [Prochlorothrix sp.]|nr:response regulator transcription factor [Prochlorothrix sp.]
MSLVSVQIIEGNPHLRSLLGWHLQQLGYGVFQSANLTQGQSTFQRLQPDLIILDADLADGGGLEFCRWLRRQSPVMVLILSIHSAEADVVNGLKAGSDDYLSKPFGMQEFLARVDALTRRIRNPIPPAYLDYGDLKVDLVQRRVKLKDETIDLTPQEFSLLYVLAQASGLPLTRLELLQRAWPDAIDNPRTVDTHILSLRKKLEVDPRQPNLIQTVRNVGYRFNADATRKLGTTKVNPSTPANATGNSPSGVSTPASTGATVTPLRPPAMTTTPSS